MLFRSVSLRLNVANLAERWIGRHPVASDQQGSVGIDRTERADAAISDVNRAQSRLGRHLPLDAHAVLENVGNMSFGIERYQADGNLRQYGRVDGIQIGRAHV